MFEKQRGTMNSPIQAREQLRTQLIEILGDPLPPQKPETLNFEWCWERGKRCFDVVIYCDGEIVVFADDNQDVGVFEDLTITQCLQLARGYERGKQCITGLGRLSQHPVKT